MKLVVAGFALALAGMLSLRPFLVSGNDFDSVVSAVESHYHQQPQHIPMMWLANIAAGAYTGGGVQHVKIAEFDGFHGPASSDELADLIGSRLDGSWQRMVLERSKDGEVSLIYVQPEDDAMHMLIADYDGGELDIVRMDLHGQELAHFLDHPDHSPYRHSGEPD